LTLSPNETVLLVEELAAFARAHPELTVCLTPIGDLQPELRKDQIAPSCAAPGSNSVLLLEFVSNR